MLPRWCLTAGCLAFLARTQASQARCDIPSWVVKTLNVTYSDEQNGGRSTLVLVDTTTNATETLTFEVIFNVIGVLLDSTPNNTALDARLNFQISEVTVQVNQTWSCADTPSFAPYTVTGQVVLPLTCPDPVADDMTCTAASGVINGEIYTPPPA